MEQKSKLAVLANGENEIQPSTGLTEPGANRAPGVTASRRVAVDAGHGGKDPGAVGPQGTREKDVNLAIAARLARELGRLGYETFMIRTGDEYLTPSERAARANRQWANLVISVHANAASSPVAGGTEALYYQGGKLRPLAKACSRELARALGIANRGAKPRSDITILKRTRMPALLVEVAFISNPREEQILLKPANQLLIARVIAGQVHDYLRGKIR